MAKKLIFCRLVERFRDWQDHLIIRSLYAVARPSVCLSSVTLVHPTQAVVIFGGKFSTVFGTMAIPWQA